MTRSFLIAALSCFLCSYRGAAADWNQWRGPDRTDVSVETGLLKSWPQEGPKLAWLFRNTGLGYSGFAVVGDLLYTMGARGEKEELFAIDTKEGKERWAAKLGDVLDNGWGDGPRGTPTVAGDTVYALGGQGGLICVQASDGKLLWSKNLKDLGGRVPDWGYAESVLVDGDKVICTPGGKKGAIAALDKKTGEVVWQSRDFTDGAQYASLIAFEHDAIRQYAQLTMKSIAGVAAKDGKLLWRVDWPGRTAVIPTLIFRDGCVYATSGYGAGSKLVKLEKENKTSEVYANRVMKNHHGGVILVGDHLFGYSDDVGWVCQELKSGKEVWHEKQKLEKGAVACADGMLYLLGEGSGTVVLIEASSQGWKEHGRFKLDPQTKRRSPKGRIWTHPVIAGGQLYLRDQELLFCFDVKGK